MAEEILRREGENILNEEGEVIARFEANNIIKLGAGGGLGEVKSFSWTGTGGTNDNIILPEKPVIILGLSGMGSDNHPVELSNVVFCYDEPFSIHTTWFEPDFINIGGEVTCMARWIEDTKTLELYNGSDDGSRFNLPDFENTIYYI